jgi:hypothetical protein
MRKDAAKRRICITSMNNRAKNDQAIARMRVSFARYRLGLVEFECRANTTTGTFEYHIAAQRRGSGTRGGRPRNMRGWCLVNLYPEQREAILALRKHEDWAFRQAAAFTTNL